MKRIALLLVTVAVVAGFFASMVPASGQANREVSPIVVTKAPPGYRDWKLISVANEEGNLNSTMTDNSDCIPAAPVENQKPLSRARSRVAATRAQILKAADDLGFTLEPETLQLFRNLFIQIKNSIVEEKGAPSKS